VLARYAGQPFAVSSALGILSVAESARREGIKVLLSGDGADECFGGYSWYAHLGKLGAARGAIAPSADVVSYNNVGLDVGARLAALERMSGSERAWAWHYYAHETEKRGLFAADFAREMQSSNRHFLAYKQDGAWVADDFVTQDRAFYLPMEMMRKLDLMTMARSVEGRAPYVAASVLALADRIRLSDAIDAQSGELAIFCPKRW